LIEELLKYIYIETDNSKKLSENAKKYGTKYIRLEPNNVLRGNRFFICKRGVRDTIIVDLQEKIVFRTRRDRDSGEIKIVVIPPPGGKGWNDMVKFLASSYYEWKNYVFGEEPIWELSNDEETKLVKEIEEYLGEPLELS